MDMKLNNIQAIVKNINYYDGVNIVEFDFYGIKLSMMSLELSEQIKVGVHVILGVKPSHITLARNLAGRLSDSNNFETTITKIIQGKLLCSIIMKSFDTSLESLITLSSLESMNLKENDKVTVLIKVGELYIKEVLKDV